MANVGALISACQSRSAAVAAALPRGGTSVSNDLHQGPIGRLQADNPQLVAAVLRRIVRRGEAPAKPQAAQFNSAI